MIWKPISSTAKIFDLFSFDRSPHWMGMSDSGDYVTAVNPNLHFFLGGHDMPLPSICTKCVINHLELKKKKTSRTIQGLSFLVLSDVTPIQACIQVHSWHFDPRADDHISEDLALI